MLRGMTFFLDAKQREKFQKWSEKIDSEVVEEQKKKGTLPSNGDAPYYGAAQGAYTFKFTPTNIGTIVKVVHITKGELDLTNYNTM